MSLITIQIDLQTFRPAANANLVIYYSNVGDVTRLQKASAIRDKQTAMSTPTNVLHKNIFKSYRSVNL
jgi:hypothetical protein